MKAAFITQPGPPEAIQFGEVPKPSPAPDQVLVRVRAVSVNPIDTYIRGGLIKWNLPLPFIVGCDLAVAVHEPLLVHAVQHIDHLVGVEVGHGGDDVLERKKDDAHERSPT